MRAAAPNYFSEPLENTELRSCSRATKKEESRTVQGKEENSSGGEASSRERDLWSGWISAFLALRFPPLLFFLTCNLLPPRSRREALNTITTVIHLAALLAASAILLAAAKVPTLSPAGE